MYPHNRFTHALTRTPTDNLSAGLTSQTIGAPDMALAYQQHTAYQDALRACGLSVTALAGDPTYPDGCFVEDAAVIYGDLVVITQPGALSRRGEADAIAAAFAHRPLIRLTGEAYLDGGDVLFCADRVLIGLSERTNRAGATALRNALRDYDSAVRVEFVPISGVLHLKTGVTELAPGVLVFSPLMQTEADFSFAECHTLPEREWHGANLVPINDSLLIMQGYPTVTELAAKHARTVHTLAMSEFEKMDGSLSCLSLRYHA